MDNANKLVVSDLGVQLAKTWIQLNTLSGARRFLEVDGEREAILAKAESLGLRSEVYEYASKYMRGEL